MLVIVPDFPPNINGLGDHAYILCKKLKEMYAEECKVMVAGNLNYADQTVSGIEVKKIPVPASQTLLSAIEKSGEKIIHLHYVGYGYQKRGVPLWLLSGLTAAKKRGVKLITTFHELYATSSKPWTSSFWLSALQKNITRKLYLLSDTVITNRKGFAGILNSFSSKPVDVMPVFSNVGEISDPLPLERRNKNMVIFGSVYNRTETYLQQASVINDISSKLKIEKIIDIGPAIDIMPRLNCPVEHMGELSPDKISEILSGSICVFIGFPPPEWFAKSGVFAAACAHGNLPLAVGDAGITDGLVTNKHFINCLESLPHDLQQVADNASGWYQEHSAGKQATHIHNKIKELEQ